MSGGGFALALTVFLACAVEAVEALTVVLAAGTTRGWRSAMQGLAAALLMLAVVIAVLGPAVRFIPLTSLRLVVGALLLVFGLQWLRKAVLRGSGYRALHDETVAFRKQIAAAATASSGRRGIVDDWYGFTLSFKGVVLEGLEVVFIVVTFGANQHDIPLAVAGAAVAVAMVALLGLAIRKPLARVPENTMKFAVGVMLTAFGIFWSGEGAGVTWPHTDAALLALVPTIAAAALATTLALKRIHPRPAQATS
ncbi:COG4280 domain-containing protein [Nocardia heshunensis]